MRTNLFPNPRNLTADSSQAWGQWTSIGTAPTIGDSQTYWLSPVQVSTQVTWASGTSAAGCNVGKTLANLVAGQTYTASAWVRVPNGSTAVQLNAYFNTAGSSSTVVDQWQQLSVTFTATSASQFVGVVNVSAVSTSGQAVYIAQPLVELGTDVGDYFDGGYLSAFWNADGTSTLAAQAPQRINHCTNPSFEQSTSGWGAYFGLGGGAGTFAIDSTVSHSGPQSARMTWTSASTGGTQYASYYNAYQGAKPGVTYTWSGWVYPSVDLTLRALAECYSVSSVDLHAIYGDATFCPANEWTRISCSVVAPAGTATIRGFHTLASAQAAGVSINFDDSLLEQSATPGDYFDYDSPNCANVGQTLVAEPGAGLAPYSCSMSQAVPSQNPNLPELAVTAWPTRTAYGNVKPTPMSSGQAVPTNAPFILSDRTTQVSTTRGRQYELDSDQTGALTLKLDNSDGAVSSLLKSYNNVQVTATWQGVAYDLWTGFASVVPSQSVNASNAWSSLTGVDGLDVLANRALRPIQQEAILKDNPERFFPLDDAAGSQSARELTQTSLPGSGQSAPLAHNVTDSSGALGAGSAKSVFGAQTVATNGATAWSLSGLPVNYAPTGSNTQIQVCGPDNQNGYSVDTTKAFAVEISAAQSLASSGANAGKIGVSPIFTMRSMSGSEYIYAQFGPWDSLYDNNMSTTGVVILYIGAGTSGSQGYIESQHLSAATIAAGVHIVVTNDGSGNFELIVNGVSTSYTYTGAAGQGSLGVAKWIGIGGSYGGASQVVEGYVQDTSTVATYQNFAVYGPTLGVPGSSVWTDHYNAFRAYPYETAQTRITRILSWAGVDGVLLWADHNDTRELAAMQDTTAASALSTIQGACTSVLSRMLVNEHGNPLYQDKAHGLLDLSPVAVFGSDEANGEIPYTGMPTIAIDPQHIFNDVTVTQDSGNATRFADQDSMDQYFQRVLQVSSSVYANADASSLASYLVGRYSEPPSRVSTLSVDLATNPNITATVLGLQVGHHVQLNHRTHAGTVALDLTIDQVSHSIKSDSWVVSFELTPLYRYWIVAANRSTVKTTQSLGVPTTVINPLQDAAFNPVEASIPVGAKMLVSSNQSNITETLTVASVTSDKPGLPGYSTATITWTTNTGHTHNAGDTICDALPSGDVDPTAWDAFSVVGQTTIPQW